MSLTDDGSFMALVGLAILALGMGGCHLLMCTGDVRVIDAQARRQEAYNVQNAQARTKEQDREMSMFWKKKGSNEVIEQGSNQEGESE